MKFFDYMMEVTTAYSKFLLPIVGNTIIWFGLDAISRFEDRFMMGSGYVLTSIMWIMAVFLTELKNIKSK